MTDYFEDKISLNDLNEVRILFGARDKNLKLIKEYFDCEIFTRQGELHIRGSDEHVVEHAYQAVKHLLHKIKKHGSLSQKDLNAILEGGSKTITASNISLDTERTYDSTTQHKPLSTGLKEIFFLGRTEGQKRYIEAMGDNEIVFAIGPAGTGKTYLAVAKAVQELRTGNCRRLVLVRPAVEAGEKLGFLPGDIQQKVHPYLAPLFDCLKDFMDANQVERMIQAGIIEILPLAFMRGRTLNHSFVILDEAQNATIDQMKMFLTRMGNSSRIVVTGDVTQVDLPTGVTSGLTHARSILQNVKNLGFIFLEKADVVRHPLVQDMLMAYEQAEKNPFRSVAEKRNARGISDPSIREI